MEEPPKPPQPGEGMQLPAGAGEPAATASATPPVRPLDAPPQLSDKAFGAVAVFEKERLVGRVWRRRMGAAAFVMGILFVVVPAFTSLSHLEDVWKEGLDAYMTGLHLKRRVFAEELLEFMKYHTVVRGFVSATVMGFGYFLMRAANVLTSEPLPDGKLSADDEGLKTPAEDAATMVEKIAKLVGRGG